MFVAEHFILNLVKRYGEHPVSTDMEEVHGIYPQACRFFLRLQHLTSIPDMRKVS
jgi:hypothetical protein